MQDATEFRTNRDLFSNHYLDEHLPDTDAWESVDASDLQEAYDSIVDLWERERDLVADRNESQLEEKFIRPMFRKLGVPFEVEESVEQGQRRPDYGFFESDEGARNAFTRRRDGGDFYKNAVAVADAKRWGRKLDTRGEQQRDFENPSYQIHVYLQETPTTWAVLTNGEHWRLYYGPTSHRLDSYYEIHLPTVLESGDLESFKYFYLFFQQEAFLPDTSGNCFLDDVYSESNVFAEELGEDLQDNIYDAIQSLAEGFLTYPQNDLGADDLDLIHDSSLIYLYRLIFVLYAESEGRDLLNTDNEIYRASYSLNTIKQEVAEELDSDNPSYQSWQDDLWDRIDELFQLIDQGSASRAIPEEDLHIPAYNGGLFRMNPDSDDSREAQFLATHTVGDEYLARVIELLTRSRTGSSGKIFVDYSSLDVRHLGSIYEGLLEYQLNVADEPLALDDGEYVLADGGAAVAVEPGEVYLTTDSGERKATGSYYTPEYVVEYIVENTLGPLVEDIREDLAGTVSYDDTDESGFAEEFAERVFDLKILDPAMGSGHFLTNTIDYLAREIIDAQERQAEQQGVETVGEGQDINWARRQVAQHCIYGVDLNPLAVELAKVSLWLRTLAAEQPLAFLDHHLKTGNSLVGSDIESIDELETDANGGPNASLADFGAVRRGTIDHLMDAYEEFIAIENTDLADAKEMERKYREIKRDDLRNRLVAIADVKTAEDFDLDLPSGAYERMARALDSGSEWTDVEATDWFRSAQTMADERNFLHWKLEFPEVFYEVDGSDRENPGFDGVIGNPPYGRSVTTNYRSYLNTKYSVSEGDFDSYKFFLEAMIAILRNSGDVGLIIPNTFLTNTFFEETRKYLLNYTNPRDTVDLSNAEVFPEVTINTLIYICERSSKESPTDFSVHEFDSALNEIVHLHTLSNDTHRLSQDSFDLFTSESSQLILDKMDESPGQLGDLMEFRTGIVTGDDEKFICQEKKDNNHKKMLFERDTSRYGLTWSGNWVDYDIDEMKSHSDAGRPREQWIFEVDEKILVQLLTYGMDRRINAVIDSDQYFVQKNLVILIPEENSLEAGVVLAIINSKLIDWYYRQNYEDRAVKQTHLKSLPIVASATLAAPAREYMNEEMADWIEKQGITPESAVEKVLSELASLMMSLGSERKQLNTHFPDYLGDYNLGTKVADLSGSQPAPGVSDSIFTATNDEYDNLKVGSGKIERDDNKLVLKMTARYKPENGDGFETDRWGYTETDPIPVLEFVGLSDQEQTLVEQFVPYAVDEANGFANFRENMTKNNSLYDRVSVLTLPEIADVQQDLDRYVDVWGKARKLEDSLSTADEVIDHIIYKLYELTESEIQIVESNYDTTTSTGH